MIRKNITGFLIGAFATFGLSATGNAQQSSPATGATKSVGQIPYGAAITHDQVMRLVAGAHAQARKLDKDSWFSIVVVDPGGRIVYAEKSANSNNIAIELDWGKARAAALYGVPTSHFEDMLKAGNLIESIGLPEAQVQSGGIPIVWQGHIIGAVGVGGAFAKNDVIIAQAAIDAIQ